MSRIAFLNGAFLPFEEARVPINDRGFTFGDGVYEVSAVLNGQLIDNIAHLERLERSLSALEIPNPYAIEQWTGFQTELISRNGLEQGVVYLQVSRGASERDFAIPQPPLAPTVVMFTQAKDIVGSRAAREGIRVVTRPELRWQRRDIKSTALIGAVMAKHMATRAGAQDVWLVEDGVLTEGGSSNIFIVNSAGRLVTRNISTALLAGITRRAVLHVATECGLEIEERAFSLDEVLTAREAFSTSASTFVLPVIEVDGVTIGEGHVGAVTLAMQKRYCELALQGGVIDAGAKPFPAQAI